LEDLRLHAYYYDDYYTITMVHAAGFCALTDNDSDDDLPNVDRVTAEQRHCLTIIMTITLTDYTITMLML